MVTPNPVSPRMVEKRQGNPSYKQKLANNRNLDGAGTTCVLYLDENFRKLMGPEKYSNFLDSMVEMGLVPFVNKLARLEMQPYFVLSPPNQKLLSRAYTKKRTNLAIKGGDMTELTYSVAGCVSENYKPQPHQRFMELKLTVTEGTVAKLAAKDKLPVNITWTKEEGGESVTKKSMNIREMGEFVECFAETTLNRDGWLRLHQPDRKALSHLIGAIQTKESKIILTYWRNLRVFEASEEVIDIATEYLEGHEGVEGHLDLRVCDRAENV